MTGLAPIAPLIADGRVRPLFLQDRTLAWLVGPVKDYLWMWGDTRVQRLSDSHLVRWKWGDSRVQRLSDRHLVRWKWGDSRVQRLGDRRLIR